MDKREKLIRDGLNKWNQRKLRGILKYATGVGKSFAAILAANYFLGKYDGRILIVCNTNTQIDNLKNEFKKFKYSHLLKRIDFICYASLMKSRVEIEYVLVIMDEIHHVLSVNRMKYFNSPDSNRILGLTASLTKKEQFKLNAVNMPVVDELDLFDVLDEGFISNFEIFNIPVELTTEERVAYNKQTKKIDFVTRKYNKRAWGAINKRSEILYTAKAKVKLAPKIAELFDGEYGAIFTMRQDQSDRIAELIGDNAISVHSGKTKGFIKKALNLFRDGRTKSKILVSPQILDEGVTLPRLSFGIMVSRNGTVRQFIQTVGRHVRKDTDLIAIIVRLYCKDTVEENWLQESQEKFNIKHVSNYAELKREIKKLRDISK